MSRLSLSYKGKRRPTDLNVLCFSFINIWYWVMSELNALDITSRPCDIRHSVETSTFWLVSVDEWVDGCGHKESEAKLLFSGSTLELQLFPSHSTINLNAAQLIGQWLQYRCGQISDHQFRMTWYSNSSFDFGCVLKQVLLLNEGSVLNSYNYDCGELPRSIRCKTKNHLWLLMSGGFGLSPSKQNNTFI